MPTIQIIWFHRDLTLAAFGLGNVGPKPESDSGDQKQPLIPSQQCISDFNKEFGTFSHNEGFS